MAIILNIDTAIETASLCLSENAVSLQLVRNNNQLDHASWLHVAIEKMIRDTGKGIGALDAVAVTIGPGSYTGLRVGLSAAKGLCMGLNIPLITINTLEMMAYAVRDEVIDLNCPLIDARRMEVFTAVFDKNDKAMVEPVAMVINEESFGTLLASYRVLFSGNGTGKISQIIHHPNASFSSSVATAEDMISLSENYFNKKIVADLAYVEPFYLKEFYSAPK